MLWDLPSVCCLLLLISLHGSKREGDLNGQKYNLAQ